MSKPAKIKPQTQDVCISVGDGIPLCHLHGRKRTAIGIEPMSQWRKAVIFYGTTEQLAERYQREAADKVEAAAKQREQVRAAERAREPRSCPAILSALDLRALRPDAKLIGACADEMEFSPSWLTCAPLFFLGHFFSDSDLVHLRGFTGSSVDVEFGSVKHQLHLYSALDINPLQRGEIPKRKRIIIKFSAGYAAQLARALLGIQPPLTVCSANGFLESWIDCADWSEKKLRKFAELVTKLNGELPILATMPGAPADSLSNASFQFLRKHDLIRDAEEYKPRAFPVAFNAPSGDAK